MKVLLSPTFVKEFEALSDAEVQQFLRNEIATLSKSFKIDFKSFTPISGAIGFYKKKIGLYILIVQIIGEELKCIRIVSRNKVASLFEQEIL